MIPLVLLPGMMCDGRMWGQMAQAALVLIPPPGLDSFAAMAGHLLPLMPPRFALAGLSMGGILAMEILRQAPDRVDRLALLDTNPLAEAPAVQARRNPQMARARAGDLASVIRDDMKPGYLAPGPDRQALLDLCMDMALGLGVPYFVSQSRALAARRDQCATLRGYAGPALVLMGAEDRLCPRDRHDLMHALMPQSRLAVIAGAGHLPTLEKPLETTAELRRWLEE